MSEPIVPSDEKAKTATEATAEADKATEQRLPVRYFTQRIPIPNPMIADNISAVLADHEEDSCIKDKETGGWVYVRVRAFLDLPGMMGGLDGNKAGKEPQNEREPLLVAPNGATLVP